MTLKQLDENLSALLPQDMENEIISQRKTQLINFCNGNHGLRTEDDNRDLSIIFTDNMEMRVQFRQNGRDPGSYCRCRLEAPTLDPRGNKIKWECRSLEELQSDIYELIQIRDDWSLKSESKNKRKIFKMCKDNKWKCEDLDCAGSISLLNIDIIRKESRLMVDVEPDYMSKEKYRVLIMIFRPDGKRYVSDDFCSESIEEIQSTIKENIDLLDNWDEDTPNRPRKRGTNK